jgi:hypothetical protein
MRNFLAASGRAPAATELCPSYSIRPGVGFSVPIYIIAGLVRPVSISNIVTNPPYNSAEGFVAAGIQKAKQKFALLLRLAFLEGANRANTIFARNPPNRVWVFSERITFYPAGAVQRGTGTTAYAWFVWDKSANGTELKWFKPGYKAKYA